MYFWKTKNLAEDLKNNKNTDLEDMKYYLLSATLIMIGMYFGYYFAGSTGIEMTVYEWVGGLLGILLLIFGTIYAYRINKKGDNKDFLRRYVSMIWPLGIRFFVLTLLIAIVFSLIAFVVYPEMVAMEKEPDWYVITSEVIYLALSVGFYYRLGEWMRYISGAKK